MSLIWLTQLHEIDHGGKTELVIKKRNPSDLGQIICEPNAENAGKSVIGRQDLWCICSEF